MSRIGRMPIALPEGVEITQEGSRLRVKGPLGTLEREIHPEMKVERGDGQLIGAFAADVGLAPIQRLLREFAASGPAALTLASEAGAVAGH